MSRPTFSGQLALLALLALLAPAPPLAAQGIPVEEAQTVLRTLVETYGPSGAEGPVRDAVKQHLPEGSPTRPTAPAASGSGSAATGPPPCSWLTWMRSAGR
jgi:hypothetical protein